MDLGAPNVTLYGPDCRNALESTPAAAAVLLAKPRELPNGAADGNGLDACYGAYDLEVLY